MTDVISAAAWAEALENARGRDVDAVVAALREEIRYKPLPHQQPPDEALGWYLFLLLGGRGSGKTQAASADFDAHMSGPACDPRVPGGHRGLVVAPTIGDGVASCYEGPAGLRALNSGVEKHGGTEGVQFTWPNGAVADVRGTYTPENIERLRASGNRCLVAGTMVAAERGSVPIERLRVGDRVWTRRGLRRVIAVQHLPPEPLWRLVDDGGRTLTGSGDHPVWADGRWVPLALVERGSRLTVWPEGSWSTTVPGSTNGPPATGRTAHADFSTASSTNASTERSRKDASSTTATATRATTTQRTWRRSRAPNTSHATRGMLTGTLPEDAPPSLPARSGSGSASGAASRSGRRRTRRAARRSAVNAAMPRRAPDGPTLNGPASSAATRFRPDPGSRPVARSRVVTVEPLTHRAPVYDLTVEGEHEFFANGIVTHNCRVWCEEFATWRYLADAFDHLLMGTRLGPHPRIVASTTPKPRPTIKHLVEVAARWASGVAPDLLQDRVIVRKASILDNPYLERDIREGLIRRYEGTRLGRQELYGDLLDDFEGALWRRGVIDQHRRVAVERDGLVRVYVGIDPSTWHPDLGPEREDEGHGVETGIVVAGIDADASVYVLEDASGRYRPEEWAAVAVDAYHRWQANAVVPEVNLGGMVLSTIQLVDRDVAIYRDGNRVGVRAAVGKRSRAEPVAALYEQGRAHHVGTTLELLEDQLCQWDPTESYSPDRLDALVWAVTALAPWGTGVGEVVSPASRTL